LAEARGAASARAALKNAGLLALASLLALGAGELFIRLLAPQELAVDPRRTHPRFFYSAHPRIGFTMNPAFRGRFRQREFDTAVAIDSLGIRDREYGPSRPGTRRIVVLGDSYTFGWGVEAGERYVDRLETLLNGRGSSRWEVVKAGINAYGTREEGLWLSEYGWALDPELVILEFCMGNDYADNFAPGYRVEDGYLVAKRPAPDADAAAAPAPPASALEPLKRWARRKSHLYVFLRDRVRWIRFGVGRAERGRGALRDFNASVDEGLPATERHLREIAEDARRHGVPVVVLIVPMRHQLYESRAIEAELLEYPNRVSRAACESAGLEVFDLLPEFRRAVAEGAPRLYFGVDRHWNREGHRLAGDLLHGELVRRGLVGALTPSAGEGAGRAASQPNR
jgi:hypothetical protein